MRRQDFVAVLAISAVAFLPPLFSAPVPAKKAKAATAVDIVPGEYRMTWSGQTYRTVLGKQNDYDWDNGGWKGSYGWDSKTRLLIVTESHNQADWVTWWVTLDKDGNGTTVSTPNNPTWANGTKVRLVPSSPQKAERLGMPKGSK